MLGRIAGLVALALVLLVAGRLGAPLSLLVLIAGLNLATLFLPGGVGAKAVGNLARRLYDRDGWEASWSTSDLPEDRAGSQREARESVLHADPRASREWGRTLQEIRALPEIKPRGRRRRP